MIVFTDREVPLADLGSAMGGPAGGWPGSRTAGGRRERRCAQRPEQSRVDIAMIYCFGKPTAISRKVDPDIRS